MLKVMCCCYAKYVDNQGMYAVELIYTHVLQDKRMQEGKKHANNSIHYCFVGVEERVKEVVDGGSPYGSQVRPFLCSLY